MIKILILSIFCFLSVVQGLQRGLQNKALKVEKLKQAPTLPYLFFESRPCILASPITTSSADMVALYQSSPSVGSGACSVTVNQLVGFSYQSVCADTRNTNLAYHYGAVFVVPLASTYNFRAGVDFGRGGAVFLDGQELQFRPYYMWYNGDYTNAPSVLETLQVALTAGTHKLEYYGFENELDGPQSVQLDCGDGTGYNDMTQAQLAYCTFDVCNPSPCDPNAACSNLGGGTYECTCNAGYAPDAINPDVCDLLSVCQPSPCDSNSVCVDDGGGFYSCICNAGYVMNPIMPWLCMVTPSSTVPPTNGPI